MLQLLLAVSGSSSKFVRRQEEGPPEQSLDAPLVKYADLEEDDGNERQQGELGAMWPVLHLELRTARNLLGEPKSIQPLESTAWRLVHRRPFSCVKKGGKMGVSKRIQQ